MRLDACTHGLFAVFPELRAEERGVAYIPVRLDEATLHRPGEAPARAFIEIVKKSERAIIANYYIYGSDDEIVAVLQGVRCQAVAVRRAGSIDTIALVERPQLIHGRSPATPASLPPPATSFAKLSRCSGPVDRWHRRMKGPCS